MKSRCFVDWSIYVRLDSVLYMLVLRHFLECHIFCVYIRCYYANSIFKGLYIVQIIEWKKSFLALDLGHSDLICGHCPGVT